MRLTKCCAVLIMFFSTLAEAQDPMGGSQKPLPQIAGDNRQIVPLTEAERTLVTAEMRQMLASIQGITDGLARGDAQAVIDAASKSGMSMMQEVPAQIRMKFPTPFAQLGMASHKMFDQIAQETKSVKDPAPVLRLISDGMQNCIACHASYRLVSPK